MNSGVVFLLDVDNTLLDNDRIIADLREHLTSKFGHACAEHYWFFIEELREQLGYVDYLGALQRYRAVVEHDDASAQHLLGISSFLLDYPFSERLYPGAPQVLDHLSKAGTTVLLTDGDVVFQPRKVLRAGLWSAVSGRVLIYVHKETMLDAVARQYPARWYLMVDDKQRLLTEMKKVWGERLITVFVRQGHYALDPANVGRYPAADCTIDRIGDLLDLDVRALFGAPQETSS